MNTMRSGESQIASAELPRLNRKQSTMRSGITEALRHRIVDGTLPPGTRVAAPGTGLADAVASGTVPMVHAGGSLSTILGIQIEEGNTGK